MDFDDYRKAVERIEMPVDLNDRVLREVRRRNMFSGSDSKLSMAKASSKREDSFCRRISFQPIAAAAVLLAIGVFLGLSLLSVPSGFDISGAPQPATLQDAVSSRVVEDGESSRAWAFLSLGQIAPADEGVRVEILVSLQIPDDDASSSYELSLTKGDEPLPISALSPLDGAEAASSLPFDQGERNPCFTVNILVSSGTTYEGIDLDENLSQYEQDALEIITACQILLSNDEGTSEYVFTQCTFGEQVLEEPR
ncbi:hypothetical protein VJ918_00850 [Adlercreutzia sp. R21]|uniref:DUF4179 domain-containing protein n=1 Tax=Adlercreutzia wanghongyangiae TaxID=3111451 RepID=A0ABU6IGE7_9ACTN|nr:hypothetical protein [Adlercreutzia sp. R21]MEC4175496.1 hypothetical protein [Adlercreutzia sp. R7]MEC4183350.1 hypothetical protein [Adlercreutzia sp. R21]